MQRLAVRAIIPPAAMGIWEFTLLVQGFTSSLDPGLSSAACLDLTVLRGANRPEEENVLRSTTFTSGLAFSLILACGVLAYAVWNWNRLGTNLTLAASVGAGLLMLNSITVSYTMFLQGRQNFVGLSKASTSFALIYAVLFTAGAYLAGIVGVFVGGILAFLIQCLLLIYVAHADGITVGWGWHWPSFKRLIRFGGPFRIAEYPQSLFTYLDVLVVTKYLGLEALAVYAMARAFFMQTGNIPGMVGAVFVNRFYFLSGSGVAMSRLAEELRQFLLVEYLLLLPALICTAGPGFKFLISTFTPEYASSNLPFRALLLAIYFIPQTTVIRNVWILQKRTLAIGLSNLAGLITMSLSLVMGVWLFEFTLESLAYMTVLGYLGYYLYILFSVGTEIWGLSGAFRVGGYALLSVSWTAAVLFAVGADAGPYNFRNPLLALLRDLLLSYVALLPLWALAWWRLPIMEYVHSARSKRAVA